MIHTAGFSNTVTLYSLYKNVLQHNFENKRSFSKAIPLSNSMIKHTGWDHQKSLKKTEIFANWSNHNYLNSIS